MHLRNLWSVLFALPIAACTSSSKPERGTTSERWVAPADAKPYGKAPNARAKLVGGEGDVKHYALVLRPGDEVATALADFARDENVVNAHFVAIGAVSDPEVGWYDFGRKQYKGITRHEQMEVLSLAGDITLGQDGRPVVHAHVSLGASDGSAWGGHLLHAIASPTLEVYVTCFAAPLHKKLEPSTGTQLIEIPRT